MTEFSADCDKLPPPTSATPERDIKERNANFGGGLSQELKVVLSSVAPIPQYMYNNIMRTLVCGCVAVPSCLEDSAAEIIGPVVGKGGCSYG